MWILLGAAVAAEPERARLGPPVAHAAGLFVVMRAAEAALWPDPFARPQDWGEGWARTFTTAPTFDPRRPAFAWDGDPAWFNLVGHGLLGAELYYRPRRCGFTPLGAVAFVAGASAVWEYGVEGNARAASALDLVYTPVAGALLGELRFRAVRALRADQRALRTLLDPLGQIERALGASC